MRVLLDEDVPVQCMVPLEHLAAMRHSFDHVSTRGKKGTKDQPLLEWASAQRYDAFITKDSRQLEDPTETQAIQRSGLHHIRFTQAQEGLRGLAYALGALIAAGPELLNALEAASGQRLVIVTGLDAGRHRYTMSDPRTDPPKYWARREPRRRAARSGARY